MPDANITSPIEPSSDGKSSVRVNIKNPSIPVDIRNVPLPVDVHNIPTVDIRNFPHRRGIVINTSVNGAPGTQPPQAIFTAPQDSAFDVIVRSIGGPTPGLDPGFVLQIGPFFFYSNGGVLGGVAPTGERLQNFHVPILLVSGEVMTLQTANPGRLPFYIHLVER
jgi:hypothetical protein